MHLNTLALTLFSTISLANAAAAPVVDSAMPNHHPDLLLADPPQPVTTPRPIQSGMIKGCRAFHYVVKGETCLAIEAMYGPSIDDLVKWNPAIGPDCTNMWADTWLCVGA
ncbi:LysM domain-containing protein [Ophiocordyceps camponoti-floridani]|uniref:LysM domain-containing protein n=1 Tax=Ophiocordyceps camponoti-floridani TaxID=2030778 RepID=A0A8H4Q7A4_9HYPO|nr:LysM domain-containing protein [Ophiocordyceps camponoti-floridani]